SCNASCGQQPATGTRPDCFVAGLLAMTVTVRPSDAALASAIDDLTPSPRSENRLYLRIPAVPGSGFERPNPLIAGGPDPNAVIRIRDRLAAHAEALAPRARWCVCPNLHHHDVFALPVMMQGRNARHSWSKGHVYQ